MWPKINVDKVAALIEAGRMQAPGCAQIEAAKADGRWAQTYDVASTSAVPEDLLVALEAEPRAKAFLATINAANRYAVVWRILTAAKAETRARRIARGGCGTLCRARAAQVRLLGVLTWFPSPPGAQGIVEVRK